MPRVLKEEDDITERSRVEGLIATPNASAECKRAEAALRHEKHLLHTVMDNVPDLIYFKDCQSRFTRINLALAQELGLESPVEAVGKSDHDFFAAERADEFYKDEQEIISTGTPLVDKEEKLLWPTGQVIWKSTTKMPLRDSNGNIIGTFGISRDITARKQAEEKARETAQMLHTLVQASPVAILAVDLKTNVQIWNPAAERLLGWGASEVLGKSLPTIPESRKETFASLFQRAQQGETIEPRETQRVRKDGSVVDVITSSGTIRDASGAITGFMGILTDITEHKRVEQALRESKEKYRSLVSNIPDVVWKVDDQFRFAFISNNIQKVSGYSPGEVYERGAQLYLDSLHPDDVPKVTGGLQALLTRGEPFDVECRMQRKDGEWIWVHDRAIATYEANGVRYAEGTLTDITERKRAEAEMAEQHRLAMLVAEVGAALTRAEGLRQGLQQCAEILVNKIGAAFARIWTVNEEQNLLELQASGGIYTHIDGSHARVPVGNLQIGRIAETGHPHLSNSVQQDPWVGDPEWARREGMVAFAGYPLKVEDQVLGVVAAFARQLLSVTALQALASVADATAQFIKRMRAEESLRDSEDRYRDLVENNFVVIGTHDTKGRILSVNRAAARMLNATSAEEAIGRSLTDYVPPALLPQFDEYLKTVLRVGHAEGLMVLVTPDGKSKIIEYRNSLRRQDGNEPIIRWTGQDVTERIQAQKAQAFLASLVESSQDAIIGTDLRGAVVSWNRGAEQLYGYRADEVIGKSVSIIFPPDRNDERAYLLEELNSGKQISGLDTVRVRHDGRLVDVSLTVSPVRDAKGFITSTVSIARDITEHKRAERALWETDEQLQAILNNSSTIIYLKDAAGRYIRANRAFENLCGLKHKDATGKTDHELFPKEVADKFRANDQQVLQEKKPLEFEEIEYRGGDVHTYLSVKFPLYDAQGAPYAVAGISTDITERKRAEEQMRLQTVALESAANGIVIVSRNGRINWVNPAFTHLTGYTASEAIGKNPRILKSGVQDVVFYQKLWNTILSGEVWQGEVVNRRKDGTIYHEEMTITPVRDESGALTHFIAIKQDITPRKLAEQARRKTTAEFKAAFDDAPFGMCLTGLDSQYLRVNRALCLLLGYSEQELLTKGWQPITHPDDLERSRRAAEDMTSERSPSVDFEKRYIHKQGNTVWVRTKISVIRDARGEPSYYITHVEDITDRKRAERALIEGEERYRTLFENAPMGIYRTTPDGRILAGNPALVRMLGYSSFEEMAERDLNSGSFEPEYPRSHFTDLLEKQGDITGLETEWRKQNGEVIHIRENARAIRDASGAILFYEGTVEDITEHREIERMKSEIVSVVSHELRTPLTSIRGALGLLAGGLLRSQPEKGERMLEIAVSNTDRLVRLINDILDLERLESGRMSMEKRTCNAAGLMTQAADEVRSLAEKAGITLSVTPHWARLWVDPDRIIQALINLLTNAIKFSRPGEAIWLSAKPQKDRIEFQVKDLGRGIPKDKLESIFERFQQVDASDRREKGGTGLGLPITRSIIQQHGGRIWVESTLGEGSTFSFTLPSLPAEVTTPVNGSGSREVLVCGVEREACSSLQVILNQRGFTVSIFSGEDGNENTSINRPDAMVLDASLLGANSSDAIQALKERFHSPDVPVFGFGITAPDNVQLPAMGLTGWVTTPVDEGSLLLALEAVLGKPGECPRVLLIEDDTDLARVMTAVFERHGAVVSHVQTGTEAVRVCPQFFPDLLVLDVMLPELDGFGVVEQLRKHEHLQHLPLAVYSVKELDDAEKARLRLGESIFLTKSRLTPQEFEQRAIGLLTWATSGQRERRRR